VLIIESFSECKINNRLDCDDISTLCRANKEAAASAGRPELEHIWGILETLWVKKEHPSRRPKRKLSGDFFGEPPNFEARSPSFLNHLILSQM
jgi:hypothetical protein